MKKFTKVIALILSLTLLLCFPIGVSAAEPEDTGVDTAAKGSLTIYKVDLTNAKKDGAWDSSYVSTGVYDQNVNDTLNSYALKDVEFTYLRVADVVQLTGSAADGADFDHVETLYGISKTAGADLLNALGLGNGANRYEKADGSGQLDDSNYYYQSDTLISALSTALKANATTVKNALEAYVTESGTAMPLTDTNGKTKAENLELGLYLVEETRVPEMVTSTCNPFFICLPMTSSDGSWIYDVTVYPKNLTGNPTLDKTLRESKDDTGKHNGSGSITDGYADTGTASDGDSVDYQIISTLPSITSASTYLTCYTFADTLSKGITYNKHDVVLEFFADAACTDPVARWAETDGKFTVTYSSTDTGESGMTIEMTADGLKEMNTAVYSDASMVNSGYSDCTLRITYAATVNSSADVVYGDNGNPNEVVLTWKRTSQNSYDTLKDEAKGFRIQKVWVGWERAGSTCGSEQRKVFGAATNLRGSDCGLWPEQEVFCLIWQRIQRENENLRFGYGNPRWSRCASGIRRMTVPARVSSSRKQSIFTLAIFPRRMAAIICPRSLRPRSRVL